MKKYWVWVAIIAFFIVWNGFLSGSSVTRILAVRHRIRLLEVQRQQWRDQISADSIFIRSLSQPYVLERFARENLYMLRQGEEIYIIEE